MPVGPIYLVFASDWGMRRTLSRLKRWRDDGLIQAKEYDELRRRALEWFALKRFGR